MLRNHFIYADLAHYMPEISLDYFLEVVGDPRKVDESITRYREDALFAETLEPIGPVANPYAEPPLEYDTDSLGFTLDST